MLIQTSKQCNKIIYISIYGQSWQEVFNGESPWGGGGGGVLQSYLPYIYLQNIYIFIKKEERKKGM